MIPLEYDSTLVHPEKIFDLITPNVKYLYIPKAVGLKFVELLIEKRDEISLDFILQSPVQLQVNGQMLKKMFLLKQKFYVIHPIHLVAIMMNPFSPNGYVFDEFLFSSSLKNVIKLPIINVLKESESKHE